jgi:hypothetical protein
MILFAVDPGLTVGWALYDAEILFRFGQFAITAKGGVQYEIAKIFRGDAGYPLLSYERRFPCRPKLAIVEEHSARYHRSSHEGKVGERQVYRSMMTNIRYRRDVEAALLELGVPSLGITPEEYGAGRYRVEAVLAELARGRIAEPPDFRIPARAHQRDAIYLGGWVARRPGYFVRGLPPGK